MPRSRQLRLCLVESCWICILLFGYDPKHARCDGWMSTTQLYGQVVQMPLLGVASNRPCGGGLMSEILARPSPSSSGSGPQTGPEPRRMPAISLRRSVRVGAFPVQQKVGLRRRRGPSMVDPFALNSTLQTAETSQAGPVEVLGLLRDHGVALRLSSGHLNHMTGGNAARHHRRVLPGKAVGGDPWWSGKGTRAGCGIARQATSARITRRV
jgi:hypothetical protein